MKKSQAEVLTEYFTKYNCDLLRAAHTLLHDSFEAEVAVQETFTTAWVKFDQFSSSENPAGWLFKTLRYKALQLYHEHAAINNMIPYTDDLSEASKEDMYSLFSEYRGLIPDEQLALLIDFHSGKYSCEDLAQKYGKSLTNIRVILSRSRTKFREQLLQEEEKIK